jgi:hypothetical protein
MADLPGGAGAGQALGALLFLQAGMTTLDAYSTLMSSPWTAENFGGDAAKTSSARGYYRKAVGFSMGYSAAAAWLAKSAMPLIGAVIANAYLVYEYETAIARGAQSNSKGWGNSAPGGSSSALAWNNPT